MLLLRSANARMGADLAVRLEVSERTVRRDVERPRDLGYPVHASRGTGLLDADFTVSEPPELIERLRMLADRYRRAAGADMASLGRRTLPVTTMPRLCRGGLALA